MLSHAAQAASFNKQLQRTVIRRHVRAASASFHCALAARWTAQCAAAELHVIRHVNGKCRTFPVKNERK